MTFSIYTSSGQPVTLFVTESKRQSLIGEITEKKVANRKTAARVRPELSSGLLDLQPSPSSAWGVLEAHHGMKDLEVPGAASGCHLEAPSSSVLHPFPGAVLASARRTCGL